MTRLPAIVPKLVTYRLRESGPLTTRTLRHRPVKSSFRQLLPRPQRPTSTSPARVTNVLEKLFVRTLPNRVKITLLIRLCPLNLTLALIATTLCRKLKLSEVEQVKSLPLWIPRNSPERGNFLNKLLKIRLVKQRLPTQQIGEEKLKNSPFRPTLRVLSETMGLAPPLWK